MISGTKKAVLLATALAGASVLAVQPAAAEGGLLGLLFGEGNRMNRPYAERFSQQDTRGTTRPAESATPRKLPVARVSSPTFYDYKAPGLVKVDFSKIMTSAQDTSPMLQLDGATFRE